MIGHELTAAGLGVGVVGAGYLSFGILRSPIALASDVLGPIEADRMYRTDKHVYTYGVYETARASISGRYGFACLALSGLLQLAGSLSQGGRILLPILVAVAASALAVLAGRRYVGARVDRFNTAIWGSPALTSLARLSELRESALEARRSKAAWREGMFIRFTQRLFLPR